MIAERALREWGYEGAEERCGQTGKESAESDAEADNVRYAGGWGRGIVGHSSNLASRPSLRILDGCALPGARMPHPHTRTLPLRPTIAPTHSIYRIYSGVPQALWLPVPQPIFRPRIDGNHRSRRALRVSPPAVRTGVFAHRNTPPDVRHRRQHRAVGGDRCAPPAPASGRAQRGPSGMGGARGAWTRTTVVSGIRALSDRDAGVRIGRRLP